MSRRIVDFVVGHVGSELVFRPGAIFRDCPPAGYQKTLRGYADRIIR